MDLALDQGRGDLASESARHAMTTQSAGGRREVSRRGASSTRGDGDDDYIVAVVQGKGEEVGSIQR